jgi:uncharacterized protein (DUF1778 family)
LSQPNNKPRKAGRPPLPKGKAKATTIQVRFLPDDYRAVTAAAKASKQTLSEWVRSTLIAKAREA